MLGSLKIDIIINFIEVFHNNDKLLIIKGKKNNKNLIYIVNIKTQKIMNIVG